MPNKLWYILTMEFYFAIKSDDIKKKFCQKMVFVFFKAIKVVTKQYKL